MHLAMHSRTGEPHCSFSRRTLQQQATLPPPHPPPHTHIHTWFKQEFIQDTMNGHGLTNKLAAYRLIYI